MRRYPVLSILTAAVLCVGATGRPVLAQPAAPPAPAAEAAAATPATAPEVAPPPPAPPADAPELRAQYDRAFAALLARDYATAARLFDEVADRSVEPERRGAAHELARFARGAGGVAASVAARADRESGRADFVVSTTLAAFYSGFVLDDLFDITSERGSVAMVTATTALGFGASLYATQDRHVGEGMAAAYSVGLYAGVGNGLLLAPILGVDAEGKCNETGCPDGDINQDYLLFGLGTMIAGGVGGAYLGSRFKPTAPQARLAGLLAINGLYTVGLTLVATDADFDNEDIYFALLALGADTGLAGGIALAPTIDWSSSRLTYVALGEFLGGLGGFATAVMIGDENINGQAAAGIVMAGLWTGFGAATYFTRSMTPHSRFAPSSVSVSVSPLAVDHGSGLALTGQF